MADSLNIAVADDTKQVLSLFQSILTARGHKVDTATNGHELIALCLSRPVELIITDIRMPGMGGGEALAALRHLDLPAIAISAFATSDSVEEIAQCSVYSYLVKPICEKELLAAVSVAMSRWREQRTLKCEVDSAKESLRQRKLIEQAKGLVMKMANVDEGTAHRLLQQSARRRRLKLVHIAEQVVAANPKVGAHG